ncbi:hypothetical protein RJ639_005735, partial [Escallonia herrerae]
MTSGNFNSASPFDVSELIDESDFDQLVSPDGHVSICGFGSLLSGILNGFRRVFAHVAPIFFDRGIAIAETKEISSLSVEPFEGETLLVTVFEIQRSEVLPEALDGKQYTSPAEAKRYISNVTDDMTFTRSGETISCLAVFIFGTAKNLGDAVYNNFLDHTFLGDRCTTIRDYLATTGSSIMDEEPPELLKIRY